MEELQAYTRIYAENVPMPITIPIIREPAGESGTCIEEQAPYQLDIHADFTLRMQGDSMTAARINDGDIVFIHKQDHVDDGEIAAVLINDTTTLKRVYFIGEKIQCLAENPNYKPLYFDTCHDDTFKILGKAVAFYSEIE
jgi:repressor LexA